MLDKKFKEMVIWMLTKFESRLEELREKFKFNKVLESLIKNQEDRRTSQDGVEGRGCAHLLLRPHQNYN